MQSLLSFLQEGAVYVIACVLLLGILIFVHELGHFLVARWCGVRVETFSLGFGKKIWKKVVGDTTYCVSLIPLGGYVKMFGDQPGEVLPEEEKRHSFTHKTVWQRIAIVLAGPLMNLFFAVIIFAIVAMMGQDTRAPILGDVEAGTVAANAGFQSGDRIVSIDGEATPTYEDVANIMDTNIGQNPTFHVVHASGAESDVKAPVKSRDNPNPLSLHEKIGDIDGFTTNAQASVVGVPKESPLWALGLRTGDRIVEASGKPVAYFRDLDKVFRVDGKTPLELKVDRFIDGKPSEKFTVTLAPELAQGGFSGLRLESPELYLAKVVDQSPAANAGLQAGDRLMALNGKPVLRWGDVLKVVSSYDGKGDQGIKVDFTRDGEHRSLTITPQLTSQVTMYGNEDRRYTIGIIPWILPAMPEVMTVQTLNPFKALVRGAEQSWEFSVVTVLSFVRLFQSKISPKTVGGLLSIGQAAGETMKLGLSKFLTMMGIISVNLFVLNLLPVPVLDGGHLVFYMIELAKGSPVSLRKMEMAQQVGMVLLMGLMVFALFNDVTRLIFGRM